MIPHEEETSGKLDFKHSRVRRDFFRNSHFPGILNCKKNTPPLIELETAHFVGRNSPKFRAEMGVAAEINRIPRKVSRSDVIGGEYGWRIVEGDVRLGKSRYS